MYKQNKTKNRLGSQNIVNTYFYATGDTNVYIIIHD